VGRNGGAASSRIAELTESERELIDHRLERFLADGDAGLDADEVLNALEQTL
jgi:hypothetical protein